MDRISHLPVVVHRALDEKVLRDQRDRAEKDLRRSEARYRASGRKSKLRNLPLQSRRCVSGSE